MMKPIPTCPNCDKPASVDYAPFCSRGCRDRDLLKWLGDEYRIPGASANRDGLDTGEDHD